MFFILGLTIDSTAANLVPSDQVAPVPRSLVHKTRKKRQLLIGDNRELFLYEYLKNKRNQDQRMANDRGRKAITARPKTISPYSRTRSERQVNDIEYCFSLT